MTMGFYKQKVAVLVPANKLSAANAMLAKHGFGGANIGKRAVIRNNDAPGQAARAYIVEMVADNHLVAVLKLLTRKEATIKTQVGKKADKVVDALLTKEGMKEKAGK